MKSWQKAACGRLKCVINLLLFMAGMVWVFPLHVTAGTIYDSPYVSITEDGQAWTTCSGDRKVQYYDKGYAVWTNTESSLPLPEIGEHYYDYQRVGAIPVGKWVVEHKFSFCIHDQYPVEGNTFHGVAFNRSSCGRAYCQGWMAYCADCQDKVINLLIYMCDEAARSIGYFETGKEYYYLCPYCTNLEQGHLFRWHSCKGVSKNRYKIIYEVNTKEKYYGEMDASYHIYDNATLYNGKEVHPNTRLSKVNYEVPGYTFLGWNTEPDGSGTWYEDQEEIINLCEYDCDQDGEWGEVHLYAGWGLDGSKLIVDFGEGSYRGEVGEQLYFQPMGTEMVFDVGEINPPSPVMISFETNGGGDISSVSADCYFAGWRKQLPFYGQLSANKYVFPGITGATDYLYAVYDYAGIALPQPIRDGFVFKAWFLDKELMYEAPLVDGMFYAQEDTVLYAAWEEAPNSESVSRGLRSNVKRMLYPHDPVFKCAETGILTINAWGYPKTISITGPVFLGINRIINYDGSEFEREVVLEFTIPLDRKYEGIHEIYVTSTNAEGTDEVVNVIQIKGTVLDEIRNRLR